MILKPYEIALGEYGVREIKGKGHTPRILQYFHEIGHKWVDTDETAWCAAFVNWCLLQSGLPMTGRLNARSFLNYGEPVDTPQLGDIAVLWRVSRTSWKGHVAFYNNTQDKFLNLLGGNQMNRVRISAYPNERLLEFRRPC